MAHAAILSTAALDPEQTYYSDQIIENVQIKLTIEGRPVTVRLTSGALGRISSRVFQLEVNDEHEACQLATTTNLAVGPCSFESPREHEQRNVFLSRNSLAQQSDKRAFFPLPTTHTTPRHALDLDVHASAEDVGAVAEALELERGESGEQKPRKGFTTAIPRKIRQGMAVKDKTLLEAATALEKEEGGSMHGMVAGATKPLKLNEQDAQPEDKNGDKKSNKQQHYSFTPNMNNDSIQQDLRSTVHRMATATTAADKALLEAATALEKKDERGAGVRSMVAEYRYQAVKELHSTKVCALQHSRRGECDLW
jgi:hypothetical protein